MERQIIPWALKLQKLFDEQKYFELHDELEEWWVNFECCKKSFPEYLTRIKLQAIIQLVVAMHHSTNNNLAGFEILLQKASLKLGKSISTKKDALIQIKDFLDELSFHSKSGE